MQKCVQYGCGLSAPEGWDNFDSSLTIAFQRLPLVGGIFRGKRFPPFPKNVKRADIIKGLPYPKDSVDLIYCSHVLEHLAKDEFYKALRNTFSVLKVGGVFRFVLPDLEYYINEYENSASPRRAEEFMRTTILGVESRPSGVSGMIRIWLGGSKHLWMWDYQSIKLALEEVGFSDVRRAQFGDSNLDAFKQVEDITRWEDCLGVECRK